jgi:predicted nucleic acid-binding protein
VDADDDDELRPLWSTSEAEVAMCRATCDELRARIAQREATIKRLVEERRHLSELVRALLSKQPSKT